MSFMKPWQSRWSLLLALAVGCAFPTAALAQDDDEMAEEEEEEVLVEETVAEGEIADTDPSAVIIYRDKLSPYGSWVESPGYGLVWVPSATVVGSDFAPYVSAGRWELTTDGDWLWVSDYEWGHIPFHYGRWVWVSGVGWAWVPGRVYSHAWVTWRVGADGYIGWAPLPPWYYWAGGYAYYHHHHHHAAYVFTHHHHVFHHHVHTHIIRDKAEVTKAAKATRPYHEAHPKKAGTARKPASPSLEEAGVKNAPTRRSKGDAKAMEYMKPDAIKKSREVSAKAKAAPAQKTTSAAGFAAPSVKTQRAKFEANKPKPMPATSSGNTRAGFETKSSPSRSLGTSSSPGARPKKGGSFSTDAPGDPALSPRTKPSRSKGSFESSSPSRAKPIKTRRSSGKSSSSAPRSSSGGSSFEAPSSSPSRSSGPPPSSSSGGKSKGSGKVVKPSSRSAPSSKPSRRGR